MNQEQNTIKKAMVLANAVLVEREKKWSKINKLGKSSYNRLLEILGGQGHKYREKQTNKKNTTSYSQQRGLWS